MSEATSNITKSPMLHNIDMFNCRSNNITDANGDTPLMIAASGGITSIINVLLDKGADLNAQNKQQETPLVKAVKAADAESVKTLICKGANVESRDFSGYNAISYAEYNKYIDIVQLLYWAKYTKRSNVKTGFTQMCSQKDIGPEEIKIIELPPKLYSYSINFHNIRPLLNYSGNRAVAVVVEDQRPYVLSRYNGPEYVGQLASFGSFGHSYMSTLTGRPLHQEISHCISEALKWYGFKSAIKSSKKDEIVNPDRVISLKIREWIIWAACHYKTNISPRCISSSTSFTYDISITVLDQEGKEIAIGFDSGKKDLGPFSAFVFTSQFEKAQEFAEEILQQLLNSPKVRSALQ
jgi:hypothetical protein